MRENVHTRGKLKKPKAPPRCSSRPGTMGWFRHNMNICAFLQSVPASHKIRICGEDLLANPDSELRRIVCWLDLENNDAIITAIKHPENSPYAFIDPARAPMRTSARSTGC